MRLRSKKNKHRAQRIHFTKRLVERFGIYADNELHARIIDKIQCGAAVHLYDQSNRVKIKGVFLSEQWIVVAYDRLRKTLVTVLPKDSGFYAELEQKGR